MEEKDQKFMLEMLDVLDALKTIMGKKKSNESYVKIINGVVELIIGHFQLSKDDQS